MAATPCFVGIDVAKAQLDIALRPTGERWAVANDDTGIAALVARLQAVPPTLIVLEATGGYQRAVVAALAAAGLPVAVVNPRQARDFANATGPLAKTDALDARALAHVAEAVRPTPRPLPDAQADELRALLARRRLCQLIVCQREYSVGSCMASVSMRLMPRQPCSSLSASSGSDASSPRGRWGQGAGAVTGGSVAPSDHRRPGSAGHALGL
jgi:transposase